MKTFHLSTSCLAILTQISLIRSLNDRLMQKTIIDPGPNNGRCLDGSLPGYYQRLTTKDNLDDILIFLPSGGWCFWLDQHKSNNPDNWHEKFLDNGFYCNNRAESNLGSSDDEFHPEMVSRYTGRVGMYSSRSDFRDFNYFSFIYCDGSSWTGRREEALFSSFVHDENKTLVTHQPQVQYTPRNLHFKGYFNFQDLKEAIFQKFENPPKNIILTGLSAGGLGVLHHCDEFKNWILNVKYPGSTSKDINIKCIIDGSYFVTMPGIDSGGKDTAGLGFNNLMDLHKIDLNNECLERYGSTGYGTTPGSNPLATRKSMCFLPKYLAQFTKTPSLFIQSSYDVWQVHSIQMTGQAFNTEGEIISSNRNCRKFINQCDNEIILKQMILYDWIGRDSLIETLAGSRHSVFRQVCPMHAHVSVQQYEGIDIEGVLLRDVVYRYVFCGKVVRAFDGYYDSEMPEKLTKKCQISEENDPERYNEIYNQDFKMRKTCDENLYNWTSVDKFDVSFSEKESNFVIKNKRSASALTASVSQTKEKDFTTKCPEILTQTQIFSFMSFYCFTLFFLVRRCRCR